MNLNFYLILIATTIICANCELRDIEEMYLNFFVQIEAVKKSVDIMKLRMDAVSEKNLNCRDDLMENKFSQVFENFRIVQKSLDYLTTRLDASSEIDKIKSAAEESNQGNLEIQQKITELNDKYGNLLDEMSGMKQEQTGLNGKYSNLLDEVNKMKKEETELNIKYLNLLDEVNKLKKSDESLKQKNADLEAKYLEILTNSEIYKKANDDLKLEVNDLKLQLREILNEREAVKNYQNKLLFDVRVDKLPASKSYCYPDPEPTDCKTATRCTQKSGYYNVTLPGLKSKQIMVFCDTKTNGGDWLHILRRHDGSENFTRPWSDYVSGFGKVDGEYWIGLENLYALTNNNGQQELYIYIEDFEGESRFAHYDNFLVGNSKTQYELKSLGKYDGTAGEEMSYNVGKKFSTIDKDNDKWSGGSCAIDNQGGWWYSSCTYVQPTGQYLHGVSSRNGMLWRGFNGLIYSHKVMYLMIRNV